ncbi:guanylate kinase [Paenibacillus pini]
MNKLILVSGASGSGKTSLLRSFMDNELISFTTRLPRKGEMNGVDYLFITREEFNDLKDNDGLMESTEYGGHHYGLTRKEFEDKINIGNAFFICDYNGMSQMKKLYDNCVSIFIYANKEDVHSRMTSRGDSEEMINNRLNTYDAEILNMAYYDEVVVNRQNEMEDTAQIIKDILEE